MSLNSLLFPNNIGLNAGTLRLEGIASGGVKVAPLDVQSNVLCANLYAARALTADNFSGNITGDADLTGWLNVSANIDAGTTITSVGGITSGSTLESTTTTTVGTNLIVNNDASVGGNLQATGWIDSDANISATQSIQTAQQLISTVATGTAPLVVSSTTEVANLKSATSTLADAADALKSATTTVNVSAATAPTNGQVLTATSGTTATWQNATSPTGNISATNIDSDNFVVNNEISGTGNVNISGWINSSSNISTQTSLSVGTNAQVGGWLDVDANISSGAIVSSSTITGTQLSSTIATGTPPFTVASTTRVTNLNAATSGTSDVALALKSASTDVNVSSATAPTTGQVLTATGGTAATWQTPSAGSAGTIAQIVSTDFLVVASDINSIGTSMDYTSLPVITDGTQFLSVSVTPTSATSLLKVECQVNYYCVGTSTGRDMIALFDGNTNALQTSINRRFYLNDQMNLSINYLMTAGTTSSITFTVRGANISTAGGMRTVYGGLPNTYLMITEIKQ